MDEHERKIRNALLDDMAAYGYDNLFDSEYLSNVRVKVGDLSIKAHKLVLYMESGSFKNALEAEPDCTEIIINDEKAEVVYDVIAKAYGKTTVNMVDISEGPIPDDVADVGVDHFIDMYRVAGKYGFQAVKDGVYHAFSSSVEQIVDPNIARNLWTLFSVVGPKIYGMKSDEVAKELRKPMGDVLVKYIAGLESEPVFRIMLKILPELQFDLEQALAKNREGDHASTAEVTETQDG